MPYKVTQLVEKRVILQTVLGTYTIEETVDAVSELTAFLDTCKANSGIVISDMSRMKTIENNLIKTRDAINPLFKHPNLSMVTTHGGQDKIVVNFLTNSVAKLFNIPTKSFPTEAETLKFIISNNPDLAETLPKAMKEYHARES